MNATSLDACWRRIGVRGDRSCPELRRFIHCNACPVSMRAARSLLDRPEAGGAREPEPAPADGPHASAAGGDLSLLVFRLGSERFAIESAHAVEVVPLRQVQRIPHRPGLRGLCNLHGQLWLCASLHQVLGVAEAGGGGGDPARRRLIVIGGEGRGFTFEADEVEGTHRLASQSLADPPATVSRDASSCTRARVQLGEQWVAVIDADRLLRRLEETLS